MSSNQDQKTEHPTHKRLETSRKKGEIAFSREVTNMILLLNCTIIIYLILPHISSKILYILKTILISSSDFHVTSYNIYILLYFILSNLIKAISPALMLFFLSGFISGIIQNGVIISYDPIIPQLKRISPIQGLKKIFSLKSIIELLINLLKIITIIFMVCKLLLLDIGMITITHTLSINKIFLIIYNYIIKIFLFTLIIIFFITLLDIIYRKYNYINNLKMTKQEVKDELRESEGSIEIKSKLRKLRRDIAKKYMMAEVPKADVVVTNPTHLAIALSYDEKNMIAPKVVAKGKGYIADKIKKIALNHNIPVVENKSVAQILFQTVEIDMYIPEKHYEIVAQIISYVYKVKNKKI